MGRILTKTRHYNLRENIVAQIVRFITIKVKRFAMGMIFYSKFSNEDLLAVLNQTPNSVNKQRASAEYRTLKEIHDDFIMNTTTSIVEKERQICAAVQLK